LRLVRRNLIFVIALTAVSLVVGATAASASCAPPEDERTRLERADAAFVGEFVRRGADESVLVFRVERGVKGQFGGEVEVRDAHPRSSVSLQPTPGNRVGLLLQRAGSEYTSNACQFVDPDALIRAAGMDADPPAVRIAGPGRHSLARGASVKLRASVSERSSVRVRARLVVDGRELRGSVHVEQTARTGGRPDPVGARLIIRKHGRRAVRSALRRGGSAQLVVTVVARDRAGNSGSDRHTVQLAR
jgi:hypothetical protein